MTIGIRNLEQALLGFTRPIFFRGEVDAGAAVGSIPLKNVVMVTNQFAGMLMTVVNSTGLALNGWSKITSNNSTALIISPNLLAAPAEGDEIIIVSAIVNAQMINTFIKQGSVYGAVNITDVATPLRVGANNLVGRHGLLIVNPHATEHIYVGFNNAVGTASGIPVYAGQERNFRVQDDMTLYGIAGVGKVIGVRIAEVKE